jgi:competence protein ComEA helix-hairpin-helix repeat region
LHGIGQKKAEAIVQYRKSNGLFKSIDDIQQVKGIGPALFAKNKAKLAL